MEWRHLETTHRPNDLNNCRLLQRERAIRRTYIKYMDDIESDNNNELDRPLIRSDIGYIEERQSSATRESVYASNSTVMSNSAYFDNGLHSPYVE